MFIHAILVLTHTHYYFVHVTCTYTHLTQLCKNKEEGGAQVASLGRNVASNWTINSKSPLIFTITYTGGDPDGKISRYLLTCHLKQAYVACYNYGCLSFLFHFRLSVIKFTHDTGTPSMAFIEEDEETFSIKYVRTSNI